jgi:Inner centromere protein, ARK binding region
MTHSQEMKEAQPARTAAGMLTANPLKSILKSSAELPNQAQTSSKPATVTVVETTVSKPPTLAKGKGKATAADLDDSQPSRIIQGQMAARAKAQMNPSPPVKSESIQLPEIDSEYSDSDDEDRKKNFDPPEWAQSPHLHNALHSLSTVNPDHIFGAVQPLHIEDMFKSRRSRFRARTSSANWSGTDGLTREEEEEYVRRMGFT